MFEGKQDPETKLAQVELGSREDETGEDVGEKHNKGSSDAEHVESI